MRKQNTTSVAANSSSGNVLAGDVIEFPERPSRIRVYAVAAAAGIVGEFKIGARTAMSESAISPANRFPLDPDDRIVNDSANVNQRLQLNFRNTTGAAVVVNWAVDSDPVA